MVKIFLDTDIGPDCDDAGALQIVHTFCKQGKAELLGVTHCTSNPYGLHAVSAINRFNGREVPLGTTQRQDFLAIHTEYNKPISENFDHEFKDGRAQRPAREVFEEVLSAQEDGSVTVVSIGPLNNIADYISDEAGLDLVKRKVCRLVSMAGRFDGDIVEWNIDMDVPAARTVLEKWPTPVVFCGWECGGSVTTGQPLANVENHPIRMAYECFNHGKSVLRESWDLVTVIYAVLGDSDMMVSSEQGVISLDEKAISHFTPSENGTHRYVIKTLDNDTMSERVNSLLMG